MEEEEEDEDEKCTIVLDIGSGTVRAGFSGECTPSDVFPAVVGRVNARRVMVGKPFGSLACARRVAQHVRARAQRGKVVLLAVKPPNRAALALALKTILNYDSDRGLTVAQKTVILAPSKLRLLLHEVRSVLCHGDFFVNRGICPKICIGEDAVQLRGILSLSRPTQNGVIKTWDDMEKLWHHTYYNRLRIAPEEHSVLMTEVPLNPIQNKKKMVQISFELFSIPCLYIESPGVLGLYAAGKTTGCVLDIGAGVAYTTPIFHGHVFKYHIRRTNLAGHALTKWMCRLLRNHNRGTFRSTAEIDLVREMKEAVAYVALDYEVARKRAIDANDPAPKSYLLPDGEEVSVQVERFRCPEALFRPNYVEKECEGIHEMVFDTINACSLDVRRLMYENIHLVGGCTTMPGICERLHEELRLLVPPKIGQRLQVKNVISTDCADRTQHHSWVGGSCLSSLATFQEKWMTKADYDESGPAWCSRRRIWW